VVELFRHAFQAPASENRILQKDKELSFRPQPSSNDYFIKTFTQLHRFIDRQILSNYIPRSIGQGTKIQQRPRAIQV
jgi:hypothetical protein